MIVLAIENNAIVSFVVRAVIVKLGRRAVLVSMLKQCVEAG